MKVALNILYHIVFIFGMGYSFFLVFGLFADFKSIDKVSAVDVSIERKIILEESVHLPIEVTKSGFVVRHGIMSNYIIDCVSGKMEMRIHGGKQFDYREFINPLFYKELTKSYTRKELCFVAGVEPQF